MLIYAEFTKKKEKKRYIECKLDIHIYIEKIKYKKKLELKSILLIKT